MDEKALLHVLIRENQRIKRRLKMVVILLGTLVFWLVIAGLWVWQVWCR